MLIARGLAALPADAPPCVVALGTFDGVHLGHQDVIGTAVRRAEALGLGAVALTFDPHPAAVLRPAEAPPEILPAEERLERIAALGPATVLVLPFTLEFSRVEAESFVAEILVGRLRAREVVVGFNHTFGRGARGTPSVLERLAAPLGVRVHVVPPHTEGGRIVSSSAIREALRQGDVETAGRFLGRPYALRGVVVRGAERGRTLGFPTANLATPDLRVLADGVYAGRAAWDQGSAAAVVNVGVRPTFEPGSRTVEAHLLDVCVDLYDRPLTVALVARIRGEMRFDSAAALRARIAEDVAIARRLLAGRT